MLARSRLLALMLLDEDSPPASDTIRHTLPIFPSLFSLFRLLYPVTERPPKRDLVRALAMELHRDAQVQRPVASAPVVHGRASVQWYVLPLLCCYDNVHHCCYIHHCAFFSSARPPVRPSVSVRLYGLLADSSPCLLVDLATYRAFNYPVRVVWTDMRDASG